MTTGPVRAFRLPVAGKYAPRGGHRSLLHNPTRQSTLLDALSYASPGFPGLELLGAAAKHPVGLAAFLGAHHRDASNPLLQPTFRVTSTRSKTTFSGDFQPSAVGNPPAFAIEILLEHDVAASVLGRRRTTSRSSSLQRHRA
jgi:hypothetical protein